MPTVVVSGPLANKPRNGGHAWAIGSWTRGLERLGCDVYLLEQLSPAVCVDEANRPCEVDRSVNVAHFNEVSAAFGLEKRSALIIEGEGRIIGATSRDVADIAGTADLLVNISGHLTLEHLKGRFRKRAFVDLDPGYTQFWHAQGLAEERLRDHQFYFTVGVNIGTAGCGIPIGGIAWRPTLPPVVLEDWPIAPNGTCDRFTTVASWRGAYGRVVNEGVAFGLKAHEFRKFVTLPTVAADHRFEIALDVHPAERRDIEVLRANGWTLVDPKTVAGDPASFRRYIQQSSAEFSAAQGIYVETGSGWFSDRTVRYLAAGKPALVQDTGFTRRHPVEEGMVTFRTLDEARAGVEWIARDYPAHCKAARTLAERYFDSDTVLSRLLEETRTLP
jgi:hypothetical protein